MHPRELSITAIALVSLTTGCGGTTASSGEISAARIADYVAILAADSMRGRAVRSPELDAAAAFVAGELRSLGLLPSSGDTSYIVEGFHELRQLDVRGVTLATSAGEDVGVYGRDYAAMYGSVPAGSGRLLAIPGDHLEGTSPVEVAGRVLLALPSTDLTAGAVRAAALRLARSGSAAALIIGLAEDADVNGPRARYEGALLFRDEGDFVPTLYAGPALVTELLRRASSDATLTVRVPWRVLDPGRIPSVAAHLPASGDGPGRRVLLVAHLDHLGMTHEGDSIYNGADDNAAGVGALLEIARALTARGQQDRPRVRVDFLFTGGEESGLIGARAYARSAAANTAVLDAVINLDMISRNGNDLHVLDGPYEELGDRIRTVLAARSDLSLTLREADDEEALYRRSDHFAFAEVGVPSVWLFAGFHDDYHTTEDELAGIDAGKAGRVAELVIAFLDAME